MVRQALPRGRVRKVAVAFGHDDLLEGGEVADIGTGDPEATLLDKGVDAEFPTGEGGRPRVDEIEADAVVSERTEEAGAMEMGKVAEDELELVGPVGDIEESDDDAGVAVGAFVALGRGRPLITIASRSRVAAEEEEITDDMLTERAIAAGDEDVLALIAFTEEEGVGVAVGQDPGRGELELVDGRPCIVEWPR
jgi:hypothetical protein